MPTDSSAARMRATSMHQQHISDARPVLGVPTAASSYRLDCSPLGSAGPSTLAAWESFRSCHASHSPMEDPEWLRGYFKGQLENLSVYSLYRSESLCGIAPFLRRQWPIKWHLGELTIATPPLTRLRLLGGALGFPEDEGAYDLLFGELSKLQTDFDALFMEEIPVDSFLWKYLHDSSFIRKQFLLYEPEPPSPRPILRLEGTFEDYMAKFSSKHRKNINREIKKMREGALGEMRFVRFERPDEVAGFLEHAVALSKKTYQWTLHNRGLSATDKLRDRLLFAAERGWFRSYLLFGGDRVYAFMVGFQHGGRFLMHEIGHDPEAAKYSAGKVLQFLTAEDLFNYNRPEVWDLQDYGQYKESLSTESYPQGKIFLFRRAAYPRLVRAGHRCCAAATGGVSSLLDVLDWKGKAKKMIRAWSASR